MNPANFLSVGFIYPLGQLRMSDLESSSFKYNQEQSNFPQIFILFFRRHFDIFRNITIEM